MRRAQWLSTVAVVLAAGIGAGGVVAVSGGQRDPASPGPHVSTAEITKGTLSSLVSGFGLMTYRARSDGSPYTIIDRASGTYTELPSVGDTIDCSSVLYRVDDEPVLLLCGTVPAYRDLHLGDVGNDVRQLNGNLHQRGYDIVAGVSIDPDDVVFTSDTQHALGALQLEEGHAVTGVLALDDAVFMPSAVRIAKVTGELGGPARPGEPVAQATSGIPEVQLSLDPAQQGAVTAGDIGRIILPDNQSVTGKVDRIGCVTDGPPGPDGQPANATVPVFVMLDDPGTARGFERVSVRVDISTEGEREALSVPVTAIVGKSGGGFAVEMVLDGGRRELVAVKLGLVDNAVGRVQVEGDVHEGDHVVVPSS